MPNTRENLIELVSQVQYLGGLEEKVADHLIANDVVQVVRCKDCKHRENLLGEFCCPYYEDLPVEDDHFCAYGERKDNG